MSYNNPKLWASVYEPFASTFGADNVLIAGGCVRDYLHSKRMYPNDIDVFVRFDRNIDWEIASLDIDDFPLFDMDGDRIEGLPEFQISPNDEKYGDMQGKDWIGHGNGYIYLETPVERSVRINVIARRDVDARDPEAFVNKFDLNICRAWADPSKGFEPQGTDACLYDFQNNTITYGLEDGNDSKSLARAYRINAHLKGKYTLVGFPEKKVMKTEWKEFYDLERIDGAEVNLGAFAAQAFIAGREGRQWNQPIQVAERVEINRLVGEMQRVEVNEPGIMNIPVPEPRPRQMDNVEALARAARAVAAREDARLVQEFWDGEQWNNGILPPARPEPVFRDERIQVVNGVARDNVGQRVRFNMNENRWEVENN